MMFAGRCGVHLMLDLLCSSTNTRDILETLFNEELGAVFQVRKQDEHYFRRAFATCGPPPGLIKKIGQVTATHKQELTISHGIEQIYKSSRAYLQHRWSSTSHQMQRLRDNPSCADAEHNCANDSLDPGLSYNLTFDPHDPLTPRSLSSLMSSLNLASKPRVAILREQGVNGHAEMAFAFHTAGFVAIDVHMSDILSGRLSLASFVGIAACGGFSYGDVLGAGQGWAKSVLFHPPTRKEFQTFFQRPNTFTLGVCNGCQFLAALQDLIPGTQGWPLAFERNASEQYEARVCMVEVRDPPASVSPPSVFFHGMSSSSLPVAVAHGEGRASFTSIEGPQSLLDAGGVCVRYVDNYLQPTEAYPANPNGSPLGIAGVRSRDGRVLALMPHPERTVLAGVGSWVPDGAWAQWGEIGPWGRIFRSARQWVG
jgi:phosphoribosylformylglycinamidine synthase